MKATQETQDTRLSSQGRSFTRSTQESPQERGQNNKHKRYLKERGLHHKHKSFLKNTRQNPRRAPPPQARTIEEVSTKIITQEQNQ